MLHLRRPARRLPAQDTLPGTAELDEPEPGSSAAAPGSSPADDARPGETESLTDAIIASLKGNPEIQISLAQQDDARYGVDEARANYLPASTRTGAWGREFARTIPQAPSQRFRSEATIALNQNLWDFGVTINDIKRARATYRSAQWGTRERIEAISYDIANAYLGVLLQQNLVKLAEGEIASRAQDPAHRDGAEGPRADHARRCRTRADPARQSCDRCCPTGRARWSRRATPTSG